MQAIGEAQYALDMACERVLSRTLRGRPLAQQQLVQQPITESYAQIEQFRLFVLRTAWRIDQGGGYSPAVRRDIAVAKVLSAQVAHDVTRRAMHLHGALGLSNEMPFGAMWLLAPGSTESHLRSAPRLILRDHQPATDELPSQWLPRRVEAARARCGDALAEQAVYETAAQRADALAQS